MSSVKPGTFYGVGLGPGDPELLTLKARRVLGAVPVIFAPMASKEKDSYALKIISEFVREPEQQIIKQIFPMTKDENKLNEFWHRSGEEIWEHLSRGKDCAFITEGDPMIYSTFSYILEYFEKYHPGVPIEVIPGISSVLATAARARVPLTKEGQTLAIYPVGYDDQRLERILDEFDSIALYKTYHAKDRILDILKKKGLGSSTVFAEKVSSPEERIIRDIDQLSSDDINYLSLIIISKQIKVVHQK